MTLGDPLAGLEMPPGDPEGLSSPVTAFHEFSASVMSVTGRQQTSASAVIGTSWVSTNATQAGASISDLAGKAKVVSGASDDAKGALQTCAARWTAAKSEWSKAQRMAAEAMEQEAAHRSAGAGLLRLLNAEHGASPQAIADARSQADGSDGYVSPLRATARTLGQKAVSEANQAVSTGVARMTGIEATVAGKVPALTTAGAAGGILLASFVMPGGGGGTGPVGDPPTESIQTLLQDGSEWNGRWPDMGPPDSVYYRVGSDGYVNSYAYYDANGYAEYRVDLYGASHGDPPIDTPHVQYPDWNQDPNGNWHLNDFSKDTRPADYDEIPWDDLKPDGSLYPRQSSYPGNPGSGNDGSGGDGSGGDGSGGDGSGGDGGGWDFDPGFDT